MILVDAGPLVAAADRRDPWAARIQSILSSERGSLVVPAPVAAEVDYLVTVRLGNHVAGEFLRDIAEGRFVVECLAAHEFGQVLELHERYAGLAPGLADLSLVALAARLGTTRLLTFDQRHFRAMRPIQGGAFTLVPFDE